MDWDLHLCVRYPALVLRKMESLFKNPFVNKLSRQFLSFYGNAKQNVPLVIQLISLCENRAALWLKTEG